MRPQTAAGITLLSIFTTTVMGILEFSAGFLLGSMAFLAASVDALTDTFTSVMVLLGLRISERRADSHHLYGHHQAETLTSLALALALALASVRIMYSAVQGLGRSNFTPSAGLYLLSVSGIVIFSLLAREKIRIGRKLSNLSVVADGYHTLSDSLALVAVLAGLVFCRWGYPQADALVAVGISILIMWYSITLWRRIVDVFMESSPGERVMREMKELVLGMPGVRGCHELRARRVGSKIFADLHVLVEPYTSVEDAHKLTERMERLLKRKIKDLHSVVIHVEPIN
ncbi:MAG: cation diffusion facilitator family transporter [Candidatus Hadarchaeales archaeon]